MVTIMTKHGENDYSIWFSEISEKDPLWQELIKKHCDAGCSLRGTLTEVTERNQNQYDLSRRWQI